YKNAFNIFLAGKVSTLTHELFVHVESTVVDFQDNSLIDKSHQNGVDDHTFFGRSNGKDVKLINNNGVYKPIIIKVNHTNLYLYEGWYVNKVVHKWLNTGKTDEEITNDWYNGLKKK